MGNRMGMLKHGHILNGRPTRTYRSWSSMRSRCLSKANHKYPDYGGRGISICSRWQKFENFLEDMGERPENTTLDRINNDGNYELENCRWATLSEQQRNRRANHLITFNGVTLSLTEWAEKYNITHTRLRYRLVIGRWPIEKALTHPRSNKNGDPL